MNSTPQGDTMSVLDLRNELVQLQAQRALALAHGPGSQTPELEEHIAASQHAYVGAAVTEIATLRAQLSGPQVG